jgi:hypothetical protein
LAPFQDVSGVPDALKFIGNINFIRTNISAQCSFCGAVIEFLLGSHSYLRPYLDINQPLTASGTFLWRVTGEYLSADSFFGVPVEPHVLKACRSMLPMVGVFSASMVHLTTEAFLGDVSLASTMTGCKVVCMVWT